MPQAPTQAGPINFGAISIRPANSMPAGTLNLQPQGQQFDPNPQTPNLLQAPADAAQGLLDSASRSKLDGIVMQMASQNAPQSDVQAVVNDFKQKYAKTPVAPIPELSTAGVDLSPLNVAKSQDEAKNTLYSILQQGEQGAQNVYSGLSSATYANDPAQLLEGSAQAAGGLIQTVTSPLAPITNPIGEAINKNIVKPASDVVSNLPAFQEYGAGSVGNTQPDAPTRITKFIQNLTTVAGGVAGFDNPVKIPSDIASGVSDITGKTTGALGSTVSKGVDMVTPSLEQNVGKALGFTGKMNASAALGKTAQSTRGLQAIVDNAPNIKVTDANGIEVPFNPSKATFAETLDAWKQTRDSIYKQYSDLAEQAGGKGSVFTPEDFHSMQTTLANVAKNATGAFKTKASALINDLHENFGTLDENGNVIYRETPLPQIQDFLEKVNTDVNPLSDKAGAQVSLALSQKIRSTLDAKIQDATGKGYQALRNQYGDLKSIESDLVNQFKKAARGQGGTIAKYIEGFGSLDVILSIMKGSPIEAATGAGTFAIGKMMEYLKDPTYALRRAFKQLQSQSDQGVGKSAQPQITNTAAPNITSPANIQPILPLNREPGNPMEMGTYKAGKNTVTGQTQLTGQYRPPGINFYPPKKK